MGKKKKLRDEVRGGGRRGEGEVVKIGESRECGKEKIELTIGKM
jgi:hypothetical protein